MKAWLKDEDNWYCFDKVESDKSIHKIKKELQKKLIEEIKKSRADSNMDIKLDK